MRKKYLDAIEKKLINKLGNDIYFCILMNNQTLDSLVGDDGKKKKEMKHGVFMRYLRFFTAIHTVIVIYYFSTIICKMKCPYPK
jgi:hypothetical protein